MTGDPTEGAARTREKDSSTSEMPGRLPLDSDAEFLWQRAVQRQRELRLRELEQQLSRREERLSRQAAVFRRQAYITMMLIVTANILLSVLRRKAA